MSLMYVVLLMEGFCFFCFLGMTTPAQSLWVTSDGAGIQPRASHYAKSVLSLCIPLSLFLTFLKHSLFS